MRRARAVQRCPPRTLSEQMTRHNVHESFIMQVSDTPCQANMACAQSTGHLAIGTCLTDERWPSTPFWTGLFATRLNPGWSKQCFVPTRC